MWEVLFFTLFSVSIVIMVIGIKNYTKIIATFTGIIGLAGFMYFYYYEGAEYGVKQYLNNECVVDTLTMTPEGKLVDIEVEFK